MSLEIKLQLKFLEGLRESSSSSATATPGHSMTIYNGVCGFTALQIVMQLTATGQKNATLSATRCSLDVKPCGSCQAVRWKRLVHNSDFRVFSCLFLLPFSSAVLHTSHIFYLSTQKHLYCEKSTEAELMKNKNYERIF